MSERCHLPHAGMPDLSAAAAAGAAPLARTLVLSLALHGVALTLPTGLPGDAGGRTAATPAAVPAMTLHLAAAGHVAAAHPPAMPEPPAAPRPQAPPDGAPHAAPAATAAPAPPLRDTTAAPAPPYFPSKALSRLPEALTEFAPILPDGAAAHAGGRLELRLWLDRDGRIDRVVLLRTQLPDAVDAAALAAFARMRFRPAEIQGVPVAAWLDTVVEFAAAEF